MSSVFLPRVASVALLSAALSLMVGAHLHLCFDGLESPATLHHLTDGGDHVYHHSSEGGHSDSDVQLDTGLMRASKSGTYIPAISARAAEVSLGVRPTAFLRRYSAAWNVRPAPRFRLPPLRGPPA